MPCLLLPVRGFVSLSGHTGIPVLGCIAAGSVSTAVAGYLAPPVSSSGTSRRVASPTVHRQLRHHRPAVGHTHEVHLISYSPRIWAAYVGGKDGWSGVDAERAVLVERASNQSCCIFSAGQEPPFSSSLSSPLHCITTPIHVQH